MDILFANFVFDSTHVVAAAIADQHGGFDPVLLASHSGFVHGEQDFQQLQLCPCKQTDAASDLQAHVLLLCAAAEVELGSLAATLDAILRHA